VLFNGNIEVSCASKLVLEFFDGRADLLYSIDNAIGDSRGTVVVITLFRLGNMKSI
jgi:hypothetical protein